MRLETPQTFDYCNAQKKNRQEGKGEFNCGVRPVLQCFLLWCILGILYRMLQSCINHNFNSKFKSCHKKVNADDAEDDDADDDDDDEDDEDDEDEDDDDNDKDLGM